MISGVFPRVLEAVARVAPELRDAKLWCCPEIRYALRGAAKRRAFMHVGHIQSHIICYHTSAGRLADEHLIGLLLHEFGHLATPGGTEQDADQWVFAKLGIVIEYRGSRQLEWAKL